MTEKNDWPRRLLSWFDANARELPWRETRPRDPYHVYISEIMLQQTRTEAVAPYFCAWLSRFPTIASVAEASEADVLHAWQGLGYYSRARNIHRAAKEILLKYGGALPRRFEEIRALPGIGDYTAGAIASIAFGAPVPAIDGNVLRVYARLYAVEEDVLKSAGRKKISALVSETLPEDRPGDFNEALMDLGAEVCIPKAPRCADCPLRRDCEACRAGREGELPHRAKKKPQTVFYAACGVAERDGKFLLHLRPPRGMLAAMWEFPMALSADETDARKNLEALLSAPCGEKLWEHTHIFTHRVWHMTAYEMAGTKPAGEAWRWFTAEEMRKIPMAGPHGRLAGKLVISNE